MGFNLWLFLRRTPHVVLRGYFDAMGVALAETVDWEAPAPALQRAVFNAIESLVQAERNSVTVDFERVEQLCNPAGQMALQSLAAADASLLSKVALLKMTKREPSMCSWGTGSCSIERWVWPTLIACSMAGVGAHLMCVLRSLCGVTQRALAHLSARFPRYLLDWMAPDAD